MDGTDFLTGLIILLLLLVIAYLLDVSADLNNFIDVNVFIGAIAIIHLAGAGIGVVSGNILPIDFFIDNKTDDFISISIDVSGLEDYIGSLVTTDVDVLAFVQGIDFINTDWSYDKEKIKIAFMESNGDIDTVDPELFFNSTTKELFAVVENRADTKIFVSYNGKISSYGINV